MTEILYRTNPLSEEEFNTYDRFHAIARFMERSATESDWSKFCALGNPTSQDGSTFNYNNGSITAAIEGINCLEVLFN